ncbi:MAG: DNA polymerase/3'-5' exonuclease PolX [Planctomycetota bacterium]
MSETNAGLAAVLGQMAEASELLGVSRFKVNALARASGLFAELGRDVAGMSREELLALPGVGEGLADRALEFVETGELAEHGELLAQLPGGLLALLDVPNLGPKKVRLLWQEAGVESVAGLKEAIADGRLTALKGFGPKTVANLERDLAFAAASAGRVRMDRAYGAAQSMLAVLRGVDGVERAEFAGSLRRGKETIGDVDLLVACGDESKAAGVFEAFVGHPLVEDVLAKGATKSSVRVAGGLQVDLRVVEPGVFGAAWMYFTGSKQHNVRMRERAIARGLRLNEYGVVEGRASKKEREDPGYEGGDGVVLASATEEEVFEALGLAWVPPELREDLGELAKAEAGTIPGLLELSDVKAELHAHTTASDGVWSIRELAEGAAARGFHTVAVTDHSQGQPQANGLSAARLKAQVKEVRKAAEELAGTIRLLAGSEVDILADGSLDYDDAVLALLDVVVASPHAALSQEPKKATERLIKAIENPLVTIVGHPTGRLVGKRKGLEPDMAAVCEAAAANGVALEINANAYRLDLRDAHARLALEKGCKLAIDTDAHGPGDLDQLRFGVATARRAGATEADVINCLDAEGLAGFLKSRRG